VLAWEDSISKYKKVKDDLIQSEHMRFQLKEEVDQKTEIILALEKQIALDRN
jgi:hypothetical protein